MMYRLIIKGEIMNKNLKFMTVGLAAFIIGFSVNNLAISDEPANYRVAVVDIAQVVANSSQVKNLKNEQQAKADELVKFVEKARKDVAAVSDEKKKKELEEKYSKELIAKKDKMEKEYLNKLSDIDNNISKKVGEKAKEGNYNVVLSKGAVLYGGDDITQNVIDAVK